MFEVVFVVVWRWCCNERRSTCWW